MHRPHIVFCVTPVAPRFKISQAQLLGQTQLDARHPGCDFAGHELVAAAGDPGFARGVNVHRGRITYHAVAEAVKLTERYAALDTL